MQPEKSCVITAMLILKWKVPITYADVFMSTRDIPMRSGSRWPTSLFLVGELPSLLQLHFAGRWCWRRHQEAQLLHAGQSVGAWFGWSGSDFGVEVPATFSRLKWLYSYSLEWNLGVSVRYQIPHYFLRISLYFLSFLPAKFSSLLPSPFYRYLQERCQTKSNPGFSIG